jgi:hypothetical protein
MTPLEHFENQIKGFTRRMKPPFSIIDLRTCGTRGYYHCMRYEGAIDEYHIMIMARAPRPS